MRVIVTLCYTANKKESFDSPLYPLHAGLYHGNNVLYAVCAVGFQPFVYDRHNAVYVELQNVVLVFRGNFVSVQNRRQYVSVKVRIRIVHPKCRGLLYACAEDSSVLLYVCLLYTSDAADD